MFLRNGILYSELLSEARIVHGFTTRTAGNLGFGNHPGDPEVVANRMKLFVSLGLQTRTHIQPKQLHTDQFIEASRFVPGVVADASITKSPDHLLSVLTADCVPVLVYHPDGVVSAIHCGWRGIQKGLLSKVLSEIPGGCLAAVGPAIGPCCYEVSEDLAAEFRNLFGNEIVQVPAGKKPHLDLITATVKQLQAGGAEAIDISNLCTRCHDDLFFSYRRDGSSGRMMAFIGLGNEKGKTADNVLG